MESRNSGLQVLHELPIIRPRQVQVPIREAYPLQQDAQEFRDIIPPDIQENPGRNVENGEGLEII